MESMFDKIITELKSHSRIDTPETEPDESDISISDDTFQGELYLLKVDDDGAYQIVKIENNALAQFDLDDSDEINQELDVFRDMDSEEAEMAFDDWAKSFELIMQEPEEIKFSKEPVSGSIEYATIDYLMGESVLSEKKIEFFNEFDYNTVYKTDRYQLRLNPDNKQYAFIRVKDDARIIWGASLYDQITNEFELIRRVSSNYEEDMEHNFNGWIRQNELDF